YRFPRISELTTAVLIRRIVDGVLIVQNLAENWLLLDDFRVAEQSFWRPFLFDRKRAESVHREFLDWLARDRDPDRPFFAFLNLHDAHTPYELRPAGIHRFGARPRNEHEVDLLLDWHGDFLRAPSDKVLPRLRDMYDDGIADLDEQLGWL